MLHPATPEQRLQPGQTVLVFLGPAHRQSRDDHARRDVAVDPIGHAERDAPLSLSGHLDLAATEVTTVPPRRACSGPRRRCASLGGIGLTFGFATVPPKESGVAQFTSR